MKNIRYHIEERMGIITLNRPEKRNALDYETVLELKEVFRLLESDPGVKLIILRSTGPVFCSGADLAHLQKLQSYSQQENLDDSTHLKDLFLQIYTMNKVIVAEVQGHALAGGCGLASVCDFVFAAAGAKFGYTEVKIGFVPAIVMVFLIRKIGEGRARELMLSGESISAMRAEEVGLINRVVEADVLEKEVKLFASNLIRTNSGVAMSITKRLIAGVQSMDLHDALQYAAETNASARMTEDCKRGIDAFLKKQQLTW